ncbi:NADH-quinone oxidoreductase subunit NuoF [Candidatus Bipolaricaulota bacterium]|nr:NADH-quinone oxidoreductase subunit NuoF [Candidatus Bipolaricaulota bacterium]
MKVTTEKNLKDLKQEGLASLERGHTKVKVGLASCGKAAGGDKVYDELTRKLENQETISVEKTGCLGFCAREPLVEVEFPEGQSLVYEEVNRDSAAKIADSLLKGNVPQASVLGRKGNGDRDNSNWGELRSLNFYEPQQKLVLENSGVIDPESLKEYVAKDGYFGLWQTLAGQEPDEVIDTIKSSGLRGRGGAGFPTGKKWEFARKAEGKPKYIICNADEGDPGAYMDRSILEGDPFSVLEGMTIGAYAIGASQGYIYVRAEYPVAISRLKKAIEQAEDNGLLGQDIMGTGFNFGLDIKQGAGAFVCGEETALISSIESKRGMPDPRPPFPAQSGLWGQPTNINNVETWANVKNIISRGADWFSSIGTENSKGTKVFSLTGDIDNTGLVEVPMGTTIEEVVYQIGEAERGSIKAVQTGGPSGGVIPSNRFDLPVDYESLQEAGSIMGSGGLIVMDNETCLVEVARFFLNFIQDESCGKCTPCRDGTKRMLEILERLTEGKGKDGDLERLEELSHYIEESSLCGLGQTAPNPVLSTLRYFQDEYEAHLHGRCPAGVCFD